MRVQFERHLFFPWRLNVFSSRKTHLLMCVPAEMHWHPRMFLLKSDFMGFRFMFVRRVREYARIRAKIALTKTAHRYTVKDIFTYELAKTVALVPFL